VLVTAAYRPLLSEAAVAEHGFPFTDGAVLGSAVLGAVILARYERHRVGTLLSLIGVTGAFSLVAEAYSIWVISEDGPGPRGFAGLAGLAFVHLRRALALGGLALMFLLAPDGRFLSTRWKYAAACIGVGELCCALAVAAPTRPSSTCRQPTLARSGVPCSRWASRSSRSDSWLPWSPWSCGCVRAGVRSGSRCG
jgi:hypothetical protein